MAISDDIRRGEGYELEFKRIPNEDRVKYLKTAVAFANGKGGSILFGVANDGTVHGIDKQRVFAEMDGIVDSVVNACSPRIPIDIGIEDVDGKSVVGKSTATVERAIAALVKAGKIEHRGSKKTGGYYAVSGKESGDGLV